VKGNPPKLEINSDLYEAGLNFVKARRLWGAESCLKAIKRVSIYASYHHPGRFADGALENPALEVGRRMEDRGKNSVITIPTRKHHVSRTLHLATTLYDVGGHSRVLAKWAETDKSAEHVIVLTDQRQPVPDFFREIITRSGNCCVCLPINKSIENRAAAVRSISHSCDRIILHTHTYDTIPVIAFAKEGGPPVAMFNHAHFSFSLGTTVSDIIINTLEYFRKISERYRFAKSTTTLSFGSGLWSVNNGVVDKENARRELSLPESATVLMSIAQEHYFRPMEGYNFFRTARSILRKLPDAYLIIVGVNKGSPLVPDDLSSNPRLLFTGNVQNPIVYYQASDICLQSFPFPSLGAVAEAVAYGEAYPVPVYGPEENILRVQQTPVLTFPYRPPDEEAYVEYVASLAGRKEEIRAEARKMRAKMEEHDQLFEDQLYSLNILVDSLKHSPAEIPVAKKIDSDDCRTLAELDQSDIGEKINMLYPFITSTYHHVNAVLKGYQTCGTAIQRILNRLKVGLTRRIVRGSHSF
jgi:hypothetical protein